MIISSRRDLSEEETPLEKSWIVIFIIIKDIFADKYTYFLSTALVNVYSGISTSNSIVLIINSVPTLFFSMSLNIILFSNMATTGIICKDFLDVMYIFNKDFFYIAYAFYKHSK